METSDLQIVSPLSEIHERGIFSAISGSSDFHLGSQHRHPGGLITLIILMKSIPRHWPSKTASTEEILNH